MTTDASAHEGEPPIEDRARWARRVIGLIDLTDLNDDSSESAVVELCERARTHGTAAVCVWPDFVSVAAATLAGSGVHVATVVNFPTGDERAFAVSVLTERARADGADEIDVVLPYRAFRSGDDSRPGSVLRAVRDAAGDGVVKVILEAGELVDPAVIGAAADLAIGLGADFVKTSTGKSPVSATPAAVSVMLDRIVASGRPIGIKPSGGIATLDDAMTYLRLADGALGVDQVTATRFRFGASGLLRALLAELGAETSGPADPGTY